MARDNKYKIKTNSKHGGKEFTSTFHFIGKVKQVKEKDKDSDNWNDVPFFRFEDDGKKKVLEFIIETAASNELKVKLTGKEKSKVYLNSRTHKKTHPLDWADRFDKTKYPDETYHLIEQEWDKIDKLKAHLETDAWVEVKGRYMPFEITNDQGNTYKGVSRQISFINPIVDGKVKIGDELKVIKVNNKEIAYVTDFDSPDFFEVNTFNMQIGIKSTYQEDNKDTLVNAIMLVNGASRSDVRDVELKVYYKETTDGSKPLADAFATLNHSDFIEVIGSDNNRATFGWVDVDSSMNEDDPFQDVSTESTQSKKQRVVNGDKKGLEITGFVSQSLMRNLLNEEEMKKTFEIQQANDPFAENPFSDNKRDPFSDDGKPLNISEDDLPF